MPHVRIEYCTAWNYYPRAASLAAELKKKFGLEPELVKSRGGVFEVTVGNDLVFSKKKLGRFPAPGEVENALEERSATG